MLTFLYKTRKLQTPSGSSRQMAMYQCSCGNKKEICMRNVNKNLTKSCGCLSKKLITELGKTKGEKRWNYKHGMFGTRFYNIYHGIKTRCNKRTKNKYYSGKGINCEWKTFEDFKADMYSSYLEHCRLYGEKNTTIDRINSAKNYNKLNCRWATYKEQAKEKVGKKELIHNLDKFKVKQSQELIVRNEQIINFLKKKNWIHGAQAQAAREFKLSKTHISEIVKNFWQPHIPGGSQSFNQNSRIF